MMRQFMLVAAAAAVAVAVGVAVAAAVPVAVGQIVGAAAAVAAVVAAVAAVVAAAVAVAAVVAAAVAGAVATGAATVPLGVGATAAVLAGAAAAVAVVPAAVLVADGVAQDPATLAALLAPNTLPTFGISNAPPTPPTTATAPTIARSRVRDRGSNLRSWLKTLLLYDTTPFPFNRVYRSRAITVALPLCPVRQFQDFLGFDRHTAIDKSEGSSIVPAQRPVDQALRSAVKTLHSDRNNSVRNGREGGRSASRLPDNARIENSGMGNAKKAASGALCAAAAADTIVICLR
jgi:hypothetical protein